MNFDRYRRERLSKRNTANRPRSIGLVLAALLLPATLFGIVTWRDRVAVLEQAQQDAENTALIFAQHADNVFETHRLTANLIGERIRGMTWPEIAGSQSVHEFLADIVSKQPRIRSLWLADSQGLVRSSSAVFPVPSVSVNDRDYFIALRQQDTGTFIGQIVHGRVMAEDIFNVAERRPSDSGVFDGVIIVSALPSYLDDFWGAAGREPGNAILFRQDGTILSRLPHVGPEVPPLPASRLPLKAVIEGNHAYSYLAHSPIDGEERLFAYKKVNGFPVYAGRGINLSAVLQRWHDHLFVDGILFLLATIGLVSLAIIASRRLRQWHRTALELRCEIDLRESVETQFWEAQKMESLGRLASESAHDFGNILSVISGSLDLLESKSNDVKALSLARSATTRGAEMIGAMLSFGRRHPAHEEVFNLSSAALGIEGLIRQALGPRIKLEIVPPTAPSCIEVDRSQLELAILNIALNARDAMPRGGTLTVTISTADLVGEPDGLIGNYAAITMKDTGLGMAPDVQTHILEPFFTTKEPGKGTGLGLSMVHGFCRQSKGAVTIRSAVGSGTTIAIYLPLSRERRDERAVQRSREFDR